jgi:hypothetical protein
VLNRPSFFNELTTHHTSTSKPAGLSTAAAKSAASGRDDSSVVNSKDNLLYTDGGAALVTTLQSKGHRLKVSMQIHIDTVVFPVRTTGLRWSSLR